MDMESEQRDLEDLMKCSLWAVGKPDKIALLLGKAHLPRDGNSPHCPGGANCSLKGLMTPTGPGSSHPHHSSSLEDHPPLSSCALLEGLTAVFANAKSLRSDL